MTDAATIGHNSAAVGEVIEADPAVIYREPDMVQQLFDAIKEEIASHEVNLETDAGRKAIASLAHSISKRKVVLENAGKALTEHHRTETNKVNTIKKKVVDGLEELRDLAREPLTKWEAAENDRKAKINAARVLFSDAAKMRGDIGDALGYMDRVKAVQITADVFGELEDVARTEQADAITSLESNIARLKQEQADREELERLRSEKAEAERAELEARKQREAEAAEKARIESAAKIAADRAANEARLKAQAEIDAANKAAAAAKEELDRQAREKAEAERQEALREADKKHRSKVLKDAKEAIMEHSKISEDAAKAIVLAIVAGSIPSVTLRF